MLTEYIGLDKHQIAAVKKKNRRWVSIIKNYPGIFVSERELGLLDPNEEEEAEAKGGRTAAQGLAFFLQ